MKEKWMLAGVIALFGIIPGAMAKAGDVSNCPDAPVVKNLTALSTRCNAPAPPAPQIGLTKKQAKKLAAAAKTPDDHLKLAQYYQAEADRLDAQGQQYEQAAARFRQTPTAKNLGSPGTASRYEYQARGFRDEAKSDRTLAASHEATAKTLTGTAR